MQTLSHFKFCPALLLPTLLIVNSISVFTPPPVIAAPISNANLPQGAVALDDDELAAKLGRFFRAEAGERQLPQNGSESARLWLWKGGIYKSGRVNFWQSSYFKSLQANGYSTAEIDSSMIRTNIFEQQYGLSAYDGEEDTRRFIKLSFGDKFSYFTATHRQTGRTLIGFWLDQLDEKQCLLALAEVGTKAPAKIAALPTVNGANVLLIKNPSNFMQGITPLRNPTFQPLARKRGFVRGLAKDMNGKPLQGVTIVVQSSAYGGFRTSVTTKTNAQGLYEVQVPVGICQVVNADYRLRYNGNLYLLPLHTVDGQRDSFNSSSGHIENFVLRTWGTADPDALAQDSKNGAAYYGAPMRVQWFNDRFPDTGTVEITLKPQGPLLDGKMGRTFVVRLPAKDSVIMSDFFFSNIPIGRYSMTAQILDDGDKLPLRIEKQFTNDPPLETLTVNFKSFSYSYASLERSGTERFDVMLKP